MRFLLSGNLNKKKGPRHLVLLTLAMALLAILTHGATTATDWQKRWTVSSVFEAQFNTNDVSPASDTLLDQSAITSFDSATGQMDHVLMESLHIDLFVFSFYFLFLGSLVLQLPAKSQLLQSVNHLLAIGLVIFLLGRVLVILRPHWIWLEITSGVLFYFLYMSVTIWVIKKLFYSAGS